jgi:hypothetical protein
LVVASWSAPVDVCVAIILAPPTAAPVASVIVPRSVPLTAWPEDGGVAHNKIVTKIVATSVLNASRKFMGSLQKANQKTK